MTYFFPTSSLVFPSPVLSSQLNDFSFHVFLSQLAPTLTSVHSTGGTCIEGFLLSLSKSGTGTPSVLYTLTSVCIFLSKFISVNCTHTFKGVSQRLMLSEVIDMIMFHWQIPNSYSSVHRTQCKSVIGIILYSVLTS